MEWALVCAVDLCGIFLRLKGPKGFGEWKIPQWTNAMLPQACAFD